MSITVNYKGLIRVEAGQKAGTWFAVVHFEKVGGDEGATYLIEEFSEQLKFFEFPALGEVTAAGEARAAVINEEIARQAAEQAAEQAGG